MQVEMGIGKIVIEVVTGLNRTWYMHIWKAVASIKSLGGNVKMLVTNPKEEEQKRAEAAGRIVEILPRLT